MCKYCKRLKELREQDLKTFGSIIRRWKKRDDKACHLLMNALELLGYKSTKDNQHVCLSQTSAEKSLSWSELQFVTLALELLNEDNI